MRNSIKFGLVLAAAGVVFMPLALVRHARGSDHADTPDNAAHPGQDLSDVYLFPSPSDPTKVVLVMDASPLITPAEITTRSFDPNVLYQFKIDNTGDNVEDLVIQARFTGVGATQKCIISGPVKPAVTGTTSKLMTPDATVGTFNNTFTLTNGAKVFCGVREDPFFFDLEQFFTILPDRAYPINHVEVSNPDQPQAATFRNPGIDFLSNGHYNCLSIVVELPKTMIEGPSGTKVGLWCTTSKETN